MYTSVAGPSESVWTTGEACVWLHCLWEHRMDACGGGRSLCGGLVEYCVSFVRIYPLGCNSQKEASMVVTFKNSFFLTEVVKALHLCEGYP